VQTAIPLGEKIMQVRTAKNLTQENLAYGIGRNAVFISRIENGQVEITPKTLAKIRTYLGVEKAPLLEHERSTFKNRLWVWRGILNTRRYSEAQDMQSELSCILYLPFERDLLVMYQMIESQMLFRQKDFDGIKQRLENADASMGELSKEAKYLYYYAKSYMCHYQGNVKEAIEYMKMLLDIKLPDINEEALLLVTIGDMYNSQGKPFLALSFFERAKMVYVGDHTNPLGAMIDGVTASCHMQIGDYHSAKKMYESSLALARTTNEPLLISTLLSDLALTHMNLDNHDEALILCEEALLLAKHIKVQYMISLSCKAKILMKTNQVTKAKIVIKEGKTLAEGEMKMFGVVFEAFGHLMTLNSEESTTYLETVAIPYLRGTLQNFLALEICDALEAHYVKKKAKIKSLAIGVISRDIYRDMISVVV